MVTDESGAVMDDRAYEPFGVEIMADAGVEPLGGLAKPVEPVTGWSDHGARWMAVELGIWTSPDPPVKGPAERFMEAPWDLNPYGYVRGNPVVYWDPDGKAPVWLCGQGGGCDLVGWTSYGEAQNYAALAPGAKRREYVANAEWEGAQVNISVAELDVDHAEIINNLREQLRDEAADKLFDAVVPFIGGLRSLSRAADKMDDVVRMQKKLVPNGPDGSLVAKVKAALWRYPKVTDARTGRAISFPTGDLKVVAKEARVSWDSHDRAAFIKAWHDRGYEAPRGGWAEYDIHHIHPRELGGTNDFWNLVPVQRETHQKWLNSFWQKFIDP